ncbi:MAG: carbon-nitrogen hydrolase family protein [Hyphomicrobiaceae bacterium]
MTERHLPTDRRDTVRLAVAQYQLRRVARPSETLMRSADLVAAAADRASDFVVLPELYLMEMLSAEPETLRGEAMYARMTSHEPEIAETFRTLALRHRINIVAGSYLVLDKGRRLNRSVVALRDGTIHVRDKIHPTPNEREAWALDGGASGDARIIETDCGPVGIAICYDSEFPELVRHIADQGAQLLLVPFCTDSRAGHLRVRLCCQARAIENQIYVATAGVTGILANVDNMDVHYAESAILTPCDTPFARDGIAALVDAQTEGLAIADVRLSDLATAREKGAVRNFHDRRRDLYRVTWGM